MSQAVSQPRVMAFGEGPSDRKGKGIAGQSRQQGKVYAMTQQEAEEAPDVIMGKIFICNTPARVLIDSGAMHSLFLACSCLRLIGC